MLDEVVALGTPAAWRETNAVSRVRGRTVMSHPGAWTTHKQSTCHKLEPNDTTTESPVSSKPCLHPAWDPQSAYVQSAPPRSPSPSGRTTPSKLRNTTPYAPLHTIGSVPPDIWLAETVDGARGASEGGWAEDDVDAAGAGAGAGTGEGGCRTGVVGCGGGVGSGRRYDGEVVAIATSWSARPLRNCSAGDDAAAFCLCSSCYGELGVGRMPERWVTLPARSSSVVGREFQEARGTRRGGWEGRARARQG